MANAYRNLSPEEQEKYGSQKEFKQRKASRRKAGEAVEQFTNKKGRFEGQKYRESHYDVDKLKDFDLRATGSQSAMGTEENRGEGEGKAKLSRQDLRGLVASGDFKAKQVKGYVKSLQGQEGVKVGKGAQDFLNKYLAKQGEAPIETETGGGDGGTGEGTTGGGTSGGSGDGSSGTSSGAGSGTSSSARKGAGMATTKTRGVVDTTAGSRDSMSVANDFIGSNENLWAQSQKTFDPTARANKAIAAAAESTGGEERIKAFHQGVMDTINSFGDDEKIATLGVFGDIWNMQTPDFVSSPTKDKIETNFGRDDDDDDN